MKWRAALFGAINRVHLYWKKSYYWTTSYCAGDRVNVHEAAVSIAYRLHFCLLDMVPYPLNHHQNSSTLNTTDTTQSTFFCIFFHKCLSEHSHLFLFLFLSSIMQLFMWLSQSFRGIYEHSQRQIPANHDQRSQLWSARHQLLPIKTDCGRQNAGNHIDCVIVRHLGLFESSYAELVSLVQG